MILMTAAILAGCTTFRVELVDGSKVHSMGAPLVGRSDQFTIKHEWLDAQTNMLHEISISRNTEESVDAQIRALELIAEAYKTKAIIPVTP